MTIIRTIFRRSLASFGMTWGVSSLLFISVLAIAQPAMPPTAVSVAEVKTIDWQQSVAETGTLVAQNGIVVKSEVAGRIVQISFKSGELVKKDQPLFQLNADVQNAQLKQDIANLTLKKMNYERLQGLFSKHIISQSDYDQATADYQSAIGKVEQSKAVLDQLLIEAPFDGKVGLRQVSLGDYVNAGDALVNLQSIDPIYVDFSVPESYLSQLQTGEKVTVKCSAYPNVDFQGEVYAIESLIDPSTRTLKVRATLPNPKGELVAGAFVQVTVSLGATKNVMLIPQTALMTVNGQDAVYVIKDNKAVLTTIKLLKRRSNDALVDSGLVAGEQVVTAGQMKLHDQAPVAISKE